MLYTKGPLYFEVRKIDRYHRRGMLGYGGWALRFRLFRLSLYLRRREVPKDGKRWIIGTMERAQFPLEAKEDMRRLVQGWLRYHSKNLDKK